MQFHCSIISSEWIHSDISKRLDASFYSRDIGEARILLNKIKKKGVEITRVGDPSFTSKIFWPERFKRKYVNKDKGKPFLMPKEVFQYLPQARKFIADFSENLSIKEGWILVTRSGSIGRCLLTNKILSKFVLSDDLIRIIPSNEKEVGYIYAFLNTWMGQAYLTKTQYGETVKHIEPEHVGNIPLPLLPEHDIKEINEKILKAFKLREEAQELILNAEEAIFSELRLPKISEDDEEYFYGEVGRLIKAFEVKANELNYRLDASYHIPVLKIINRNLRKGELKGYYKVKRLGDIADVFDLPTYKRIYVTSKEGYPILSGSHLNQIKIFDLKYIHNMCFYYKGRDLSNRYKVQKGWILVAERGTTGISALVTRHWDGWFASHNILRVVPKRIHPGFILAYLETEYAQYQLRSKQLGAVVEVLDPKDMEKILVPLPHDKSVEEKIGNLVIEAYEKKDKASMIENEAIKFLERKLEEMAK